MKIKMKKIIYTILILSISLFTLQGQSLKTYSGPYSIKNSTFKNGSATYSYYEKGGEEIKKGNFSFKVKSTNYAGSMEIIIKGKYKDNLKTGLWTYTLNVISSQTGAGTMTMILKAKYLEGLPNGLWQFSLVADNNKVTSNVSAYFEKGIVVDNFTYKAKDNTKSVTYDAKLDKEGYLISFSRKENQYNNSGEYYKSILITGANGGLGKESARQLALIKGTEKIYLACRNLDKAQDAKRSLENSTGKKIFEIVNERINKYKK